MMKVVLPILLAALAVSGFLLGVARLRADLIVPWAAGYSADAGYLRIPLRSHAVEMGLVFVCAVVALVARPAVAAWARGIGAGLLVVCFIMFPSLASLVELDPVRDAGRVTDSVAEAIKVSARQSGHWPTAREVELSAGVGQRPTPWMLHGVPLLYHVTIDKRDAGAFAVPPPPGIITCVTDDAAGEIECRFAPPAASDPRPDADLFGVHVARCSLSDKY